MPSFERPGRFLRRTWSDLQLLKSQTRKFIRADGTFSFRGDGATGAAHDHTTADGSGVLTNDEHDGYGQYAEIATPATPAANKLRLYAKDSAGVTKLYYKDDAGNEVGPLGTGTGAVAGAVGGQIDIGDAASNGASTDFARADHQHANPAPGAGYPVDVEGTEADGSATTAARSDHQHKLGITTTRGDIVVRGASANQRLAVGASGTVLRSDGTDPAWTTIYSVKDYVNAPDAAIGAVIAAGNQQGLIFHSGPANETAIKLYVDAETAPGASGLPVTWEFGDTDDLDTVASWTQIATLTLSSEKSANTSSMTNATVTANRLVRTNIGTIVGSPKDATTTLRMKCPLST